MPYLLGSMRRDLTWMVLPGVIALFLYRGWNTESDWAGILALLAFGACDLGHILVTAFRTYLNGNERRSSSRYLWLPVAVFGGCFAWYYLRLPYLWQFLLYFTGFHNIKQYYGFSRWYQMLNGRACRATNAFIYAFGFLCIGIFHLRPGSTDLTLSEDLQYLFYFHRPGLLTGLYWLYAGLVVSWLAHELYRLRKDGRFEFNRFLSVLTPAVVYSGCFLWGRNFLEVLGPLVVSHGVAYYAITAQTLRRTQPARFGSLKIVLLRAVGASAIAGMAVVYVDQSFLLYRTDYVSQSPSLWGAVVAAALTGPNFLHFLIDGVIWKRSHREAPLTFGKIPQTSPQSHSRPLAA